MGEVAPPVAAQEETGMSAKTKICERCEVERPLERFRKCRFTTDGLTHKCKDCVKMPPRYWGVHLGVITSQTFAKQQAALGNARYWPHTRPGLWESATYEVRPDWFKATRPSGRPMKCKLLDLREETVLVNTLDIREAVWVANQMKAKAFPELEEARAEWVAWKARDSETKGSSSGGPEHFKKTDNSLNINSAPVGLKS